MENANKSDGAAVNATGGVGVRGGRLLVDESCSDRKRFEIELKEGETTIVSWAKLLKDSGSSVDKSPPSSPGRKRLHQEDESRSECSNITLKKEMDEQNYRPPTRQKTQSAISGVQEGMDVVQATKNTKTGHARVKSITLTHNISEEHSVNNAKLELPDLNVPYTVQTASISPADIKDESCGLMNGSMLESTILEIETMVADSTRRHGDLVDANDSVKTKSRLPRELKLKLGSVVKLAHSIEGRISDDLIMRLMSILGHWLKLRTLKRCLRDMAPSDLSAWGGDAVRFSMIEKEVLDMIKLRIPSMETKDGSSNTTMELCAVYKAKYSMDHEMEDKVCDFYDIYVQGMGDIKSSEIRKFYIQLAALWPKGTMDNHAIRNAICRSKERRRTALQEKEHEDGNAGADEDLQVEAKLVSDSKRPINDNNAPVLNFQDPVVPSTPELDQNLSAPAKRFSPSSAGSCQDLYKQRKFNILNETT